jgi:Fur family iron response transcriptional regulator
MHQLRAHGIQPSAQRLAVASVVLGTDRHPSADEVHAAALAVLPSLSRATVYNTLNLFVEKGLLRALALAEGRVVFDPHTAPHHHFIDEDSGRIYDLPWEALEVRHIDELEGFSIRDYQVVVRGQRTSSSPGRPEAGRGARGSTTSSRTRKG